MRVLMLLLACSKPAVVVTGDVVDIWGRPLPGATVVVEGVVQRWQADPAGTFSLTLEEVPSRVLGAAPGHMRAAVTLPQGSEGAPLRLALWPEPKAPGFYAVGSSPEAEGGLLHLAARGVTMLGSGDRARPVLALALDRPVSHVGAGGTTGSVGSSSAPVAERMPGPGSARGVPGGTTRFLHKSTLDPRAFRELALRLSRLEEVAVGERAAAERRWAAAEAVEVRVEALPGKDCYLLEVPPLRDGVYAFHTGRVLDLQDAAALAALPRERLLAWAFQVVGAEASAD